MMMMMKKQCRFSFRTKSDLSLIAAWIHKSIPYMIIHQCVHFVCIPCPFQCQWVIMLSIISNLYPLYPVQRSFWCCCHCCHSQRSSKQAACQVPQEVIQKTYLPTRHGINKTSYHVIAECMAM